MAARPTWKGHLRLSLVSCPVRLYPATSRSERISFHLLNPETNNRIQMRPHDAGTGEEVPRSELVRGYEFDKNKYVVIDKSDLDALQIESSKTIDLKRFVDKEEVTPVYWDTPYYLVPDGRIAEETFAVIQEAMREEGKVGIGRLVLSTREHAVLLAPHAHGMLLTTLRPAEEVRRPSELDDIDPGDVDKDMIEMARRIIEQKSGKFDTKELAEDRYQAALHELVAKKMKGKKPIVPKVAEPTNVINLMDALKRSLGAEGRKGLAPSAKRGASKRTKTPRKRAST